MQMHMYTHIYIFIHILIHTYTYMYTYIYIRIHTELDDTMYVPCMNHTPNPLPLGFILAQAKKISSCPYRLTTGELAGISQASIVQPGTGRNHTSKCCTACKAGDPSQWLLHSRHSANSRNAAHVLPNSYSASSTLGKMHTSTNGEV